MSIKNRLLFILLACSIFPMIFVGTLGYFNAKKALENTRIDSLNSITYFKAKKIEDFFAEQIKHIKIAQHRPSIKQYTSMLAEFSGDFSSPFYETLSHELDIALKMYPPVYDYINVMLANPEGRIVYVLNRNSAAEIMDNFQSGAWQKAFEEGKTEIYLSNVFMSRTQVDQFSILITAPVHDFDGNFVGVLALEINMASIFKLVQDSTGMGETGETLVAKERGRCGIISESSSA